MAEFLTKSVQKSPLSHQITYFITSAKLLFSDFLSKKLIDTVVSPNKGTFKIYEIGSKMGILPLFIRFPYLKSFDKFLQKVRSHVVKFAF